MSKSAEKKAPRLAYQRPTRRYESPALRWEAGVVQDDGKERFNLDKMLSCNHVIIQILVVNENIFGYI